MNINWKVVLIWIAKYMCSKSIPECFQSSRNGNIGASLVVMNNFVEDTVGLLHKNFVYVNL